MQLNDFNHEFSLDKLQSLLREEFNLNLDLNGMTEDRILSLREKVEQKLIEFRQLTEFHTSEQNPKYLAFLSLKQLLEEYEITEGPGDVVHGLSRVAHGVAAIGSAAHLGWKGKPLSPDHGKVLTGKEGQLNPEIKKLLAMPQFKGLTDAQKLEIGKQLQKIKTPGKIVTPTLTSPAPTTSSASQNVPVSAKKSAKKNVAVAPKPVNLRPSAKSDAVSALVNLGKKRDDAVERVRKAVSENPKEQTNLNFLIAKALSYGMTAASKVPEGKTNFRLNNVKDRGADHKLSTKEIETFLTLKGWEKIEKDQDLDGKIYHLYNWMIPSKPLTGFTTPSESEDEAAQIAYSIFKQEQVGKKTMKKNTSRTIGESLLKLRAKRYIAEGEMQNAEAALAAKDLVDRLQDTVEEVSKMANEELPHLIDAVRGAFGDDKAAAYQAAANEVLSNLLDEVKEKKSTLENATLVLTGDAQADASPDLALPDGEGEDLDLGDGEDDALAGDAADELDKPKSPLGRDVRPEAELESKKNTKNPVNEAKKKTSACTKCAGKGCKLCKAKVAEAKKTEKEEKLKKDKKKKKVAEAAVRKALSKACKECKAKSGEKCKHLKKVNEAVSPQFGGIHMSRWKAVLSEKK